MNECKPLPRAPAAPGGLQRSARLVSHALGLTVSHIRRAAAAAFHGVVHLQNWFGCHVGFF